MNLEQHILLKYRLSDNKVIGPRGEVQGTQLGNGYMGTGIRWEGKIKRVLMHRMVFLLEHGHLPETVDHINGDRADNSVNNLRAADKRQQQGNRAGCGYTVRTKRYAKPRYEVNCDHKYIGVFDTKEEAQSAYMAARSQAFGEFARAV